MNDLIHADVFFFITSIAVVLLSLGAAVALWYMIGILRDVREIVARIRKASGEIEEDFEALRSHIKAEGSRVRGAFDLLFSLFTSKITPKRKKKAVEEELTD